MNIPRRMHSLIQLNNGNILASGGVGMRSCEIYDMENNSWRYTDSLNYERGYHKSVLLNDGRVLVIGSYDQKRSCELFDPITEQWSITDSILIGRLYGGYNVVKLRDGRVMLIGGWRQDSLGTPVIELEECEIFDPLTEKWSSVASMNIARYGASATVLKNGKVFVAGGQNLENKEVRTCELYDPSNNTWVFVDSMNFAKEGHTAILLSNGNVFIADGSISQIYNTGENKWEMGADLLYNRLDPAVFYLPESDKALIVGGSYVNETQNDTWEVYDLKKMEPVYSEPFPIRMFLSQNNTIQLSNGSVLVVGGWEFEIINGITYLTRSKRCWELKLVTDVNQEKDKNLNFSLHQNYPNPFNPSTVIEYEIGHTSDVQIKIYNSLGEIVETLLNKWHTPGSYRIEFTAGTRYSSGVYIYEISTEDYYESKKMILLK
jgi:N-acetylneuraminic acid mutarotase